MTPILPQQRRAPPGAPLCRSRRSPRLGLLALLPVLLLTLAGWAAAAPCSADLHAAFAAETLTQPASGRDALAALRRAVELSEPALPVFAAPRVLPLAADDPAYGDALFLAQRGLLPDRWQPEAIDATTWNAMLTTLLGWYGLDAARRPAPVDRAALLADLEAVLTRVAAAVRPLALIAWDPERGDALAFAGLVWNWSVYPRLIVRRPPAGLTLDSAGGFDGIMAALSSCAVPVQSYIAAPLAVATELYLGSPEARMVLLSSDPTRADWPYWVAEGEELAVFRFVDPLVRDLDAYAAAFAGSSLGPGQLLRLLPRVRTNLGPRGVLRYLATPPR